jgi:hypothetical protein
MNYEVDIKFAHGISYTFIVPEDDMVKIRRWIKDLDGPMLSLHYRGLDYYFNREFLCSGHIGVSMSK